MKPSNQGLLEAEINFLVCSLCTLSPNDKTFKFFNRKSRLAFRLKKESLTLITIDDLSHLREMLNRKSLRQFSYQLLEPIIEEGDVLEEFYLPPTPKLDKNTILLKRYLKKFKHTYSRYFYCKLSNYNTFPTDKEINTLALKSLILLVGI